MNAKNRTVMPMANVIPEIKYNHKGQCWSTHGIDCTDNIERIGGFEHLTHGHNCFMTGSSV